MKAPAVTALTVAAAIGAGVSTIHATDKRARFESRWLTAPIAVDGSPIDWPGPLAPFNDQPLSMAASNDGDSLYLVLTASEPAVRRQILRQGLIVWFDGGAKDKKKFGVKFPIGVGITEEELRGRRHGGGAPDSGGGGAEPGDRAGAPA